MSTAPIAAAASRLTAASRVLVTGFVDVPLAAVTVACDVAEVLGAAVDAGSPEMDRAAGPTIARVGEVTAAWEEMRDRADLVIFWFCDPDAVHPGFTRQFVTPAPVPPLARRTVSIGPVSAPMPATCHCHLSLARAAAVDAARAIHLMLLGGEPPELDGALANACDSLRAAIDAASCVAFVTDDTADPLGLEAWSLVHLVRAISPRKPAFEIPLAARSAADAAAVCTWRYGAAGAIARADRGGWDVGSPMRPTGYSGKGTPPARVLWFQVDAFPPTRPANARWSLQVESDGVWTLENRASGERLEAAP